MFFPVSKLFWLVAQPGNLLVIVLGLGALLLWTRWRRIARHLVTGVAVVFAALTVLPIGEWLLSPLEEHVARPTVLPEHVAGIVVLGGAVDALLTESRGELQVRDSGERIIAGLQLARRYPEARLLFTGGVPGLLTSRDSHQGRWLSPLLRDAGVSADRVIYEDRSGNTYENALFSQRLVAPDPGATWILVTSAFHMPRAVGCFRNVGWTVVPYPVDFQTRPGLDWTPQEISLLDGLALVTTAIREWTGLIAYRLTGRTPSLLPEAQASERDAGGN